MSTELIKNTALLVLFVFCSAVKTHGQETLTLGVHPYLPATELVQRFAPLVDYLSQQTKQAVRLRISKSYQEHIDETGKDRLDIVFIGPASYVRMVSMYGKKPILARLEVEGKPFFRGAIVIRENSPLRSLAELRGKRFAFGDPLSTMSHLVPRYTLWKAGVGTQDLAGFEYLDSHHNVALGVLIGDFDAGAVKEEVVARYQGRGLRVLATTLLISEHLFVSRGTLPDTTVQSLREALYKLNTDPQGRAIIHAIKATATGMVAASDTDYDDLRGIFKTLQELGVRF